MAGSEPSTSAACASQTLTFGARPRALGSVAGTSEATRGYALGSVWLPRSAGYHVVLEPDPGGGYVAVVPAFPGCYSQGETEKEALENVREAILLTIEDMRERGEAIPDPAGELVRHPVPFRRCVVIR